MTFEQRNALHERAKAKIKPVFERYGFDVFEHGIELSKDLAEAMREQDDRCSLMIRYRPDFANVFRGGVAVLCEVKYRWTIEARSFLSIREWNAGGNVAMLAVSGEESEAPRASWVSDLPPPTSIAIPKRWDWEEQMESMTRLYPGIPLRQLPPPERGASGTPFFNLPRRHFKLLDSFICVELLGIPDPHIRQLDLGC